MDLLQEITKPYLRNDLPPLKIGEKVKVIMKVSDKRLSSFEGIIISKKRPKQISYNFTVIKESSKLVIKQIFYYHSSLIVDIKKMGMVNRKVKRAKLNFLERNLAAKKAGE